VTSWKKPLFSSWNPRQIILTVFLSVIIPAHNEENRLPKALEQVLRFLKEQSFTSEVIVVENGSSDKTLEVAQKFTESHKSVRVIQSERGKGAAVKRGMLEAQGEYRFMCDADLSMPVEEIAKFLPPTLKDFDIAIASREAKGAVRYNEPSYRHLGGRGINFLIQLFILPGLNDTQCGFKCLRADVAEKIFNLQTLQGWSFAAIRIPYSGNPHSLVSRCRHQGQGIAGCHPHVPGYFPHPCQCAARRI